MIELYNKGTTDFSKNGRTLKPSESTVTYVENGQYDLELVFPVAEDTPAFDYGMIIKCTVPEQQIDDIYLGLASYWTVTDADGATLYESIPTRTRVSYSQWSFSLADFHPYSVGDKVTYNRQNYQCTAYDAASPLVQVPPSSNSSWWTEIANYKGSVGKVAEELSYGDVIVRTGDFNDEYMQAASMNGKTGYIRIDKCTDTGETEQRVIEGWTIREQCFVITDILKEDGGGKNVRVTCDHLSYQLGRTTIGDCNLTEVNPATAVLFIKGAMQEEYPGDIETNLTDITLTADFSWKNAQAAILDPKSGVLQATGGVIIRDNYNVYLLSSGNETPKYSVRYGANMKSVKWTGTVDNIVTRVYPTAQTEDGSTLLLPEKYIDTSLTVPFIRPEVLKTGLKIGDKVTATDGTETELTEDEIYDRMRDEAEKRFYIDHADRPEVKLELDWIHMPDTEEYAEYTGLKNAAPGNWVEVVNGPLGVSVNIRMTGYTWDPILCRYKSTTFGEVKVKSTVPGYSLQSGAVTARVLAAGAVGSESIQANSITAVQIAAGSITAEEIASRSIITELIAAGSVTADEIAAGSITATHIASHTITADQIAAGAITADQIAAGAITADKIAAGAVTSEKIYAGAITAQLIASGAITTDKLDAGAVTAGKIAAGAITAAKIDTTDLSAIQATLQIANIADARIASADIDYAHIKDLAADLAIFSTTITEQGIADRLFINRLMITYGQMVSATIGDLVIGASDGNYYHVDIEWDEDGVPTLVPTLVDTPTAEEIAEGHTTDGHTIIGNIGTFAELSSEDFYAINAIIDRITAKRIDVDELWARQAFIDNLMVQDISSNTYIQSTIGNWQSQSTITQTVQGLSTRISQLGYGTIYYSATEPSHENLVLGDIWVQPLDDHIWEELSEETWQQILNGGSWGSAMGAYKVYTWSGQYFKLMFDSTVNVEMWTAIEQNAYAITLKASQTDMDILSGEVTEFAATLDVQAQAISAAVSAVNTKASTYMMWADPRTAYTVTLGDFWIKTQDTFGTWLETKNSTWQTLKNNYTWKDALGGETYVWDGTKWVMTSDRASEIAQNTLISQTSTSISLLAETTAKLGEDEVELRAQLVVANDRITQEVMRATTAEDGKLAKTSQYQTADAIVSEAVSVSTTNATQLFISKESGMTSIDDILASAASTAESKATTAANGCIAKTTQYQSATAIVSAAVAAAGENADNAYIAQTNVYQTADAIVSEAVRQAGVNAGNGYIAKTQVYQDAASIVATAEGYTDNKLTNYATLSITDSKIAAYVTDNAYGKVSGIEITANGVDISGSQHVNIASGGTFKVTSGNFSIDSSSNDYVIWSGAATAAASQFRVKKDGTTYITKLVMVGENGTETTINLRTAALWKLSYATVKSITTGSDSFTITTTSGSTTVNFKTAADVRLDIGAFSGGSCTVKAYLKDDLATTAYVSMPATAQWSSNWFSHNPPGISVTCTAGGKSYTQSFTDSAATDRYNEGWNACRQAVIDALGGATVYSTGTFYAQLFVAPVVGAQQVNNCRAGQSYYTIPEAS